MLQVVLEVQTERPDRAPASLTQESGPVSLFLVNGGETGRKDETAREENEQEDEHELALSFSFVLSGESGRDRKGKD